MRYLRVIWTSPNWKNGAPICMVEFPMADGVTKEERFAQVYESITDLDKPIALQAEAHGIAVTRRCEVIEKDS